MSNWSNILRTAKSNGDFAGRAQAEQDAYFEFFAGREPGDRAAMTINVRNLFTQFHSLRAARGLRRLIFGVAFSRSTKSP